MQCWAELHFVGLSKLSFKECFLVDINVKTRAEVSWAAGEGRGHETRAVGSRPGYCTVDESFT